MQRNRLISALASLGLATCSRAEQCVEPPIAGEPALAGAEPSGFGDAPKPAQPARQAALEPHFEGVPLEFCQATLTTRDDPLVHSASFLAMWNELAPWVHNRRAPNIPEAESDARVAVCGSPTCTVDSARVVEVQADYNVGVGVLIPWDAPGELLAVPDVAPDHNASSCTNTTTATVERHGPLVHVRARTVERRYNYGHGYHGYGGRYEPMPVECMAYAPRWRDLIIDAERGELELVIDHSQAEPELDPRLELIFDPDYAGVIVRGCGTMIELQWTG